ncbi:hypothetical protein PIROE2DRAFT_5691 [Piromyces sp. E2]|nr:hypothetical protein PIROE2DRAFT_5691 [Piromyces sp. E2]|eukprot:OUM66955.1 hypothetical protein PIROE2DRAFT_5691 [Piromyces sp. E2]
METRRTRQSQSDGFYKDNRYKTRNDNNRNNKSRRSNTSEYSRNSYSKKKENSTSEGSKKFENPKFFYKRVHGNYSKLYVPEAYENSKRNEKKASPKSDKETHSQLEFQDVSSNDENQNDINKPPQTAVRKNSKGDMKANEANDKKEKLKTIYSQIKKLESKLDREILLEELNEFSFNMLTKEHLLLINKYIELIQESYKIAIFRYDMDTKIWKLGIYKLFNLFRNYLNDLFNYQNEDSESSENIKQIFAYFINESLKSICFLASILKPYDTNSDVILHENIKFNRYQIAWHRCMFYINDLLRYQYLHGLKLSEDLEKLWKRAYFINKNVINISPNNGLLYHQMAILQLSKDNKFEALYYFLRSLCVKNPYSNARETHLSFFDNTFQEFSKICNEYSSVYNIETFSVQFVHLHGILYTKIGTENFNAISKRLMKGIKAQSERLSPFWIRTTALCNIAMLHHYINIKNDSLLTLPLQFILEQLETNIRIFLDKQDKKFLHHIEIFLYWVIISYQNNEPYIELMKPKLKVIWPLLVKACNFLEQRLFEENIEIKIIENKTDENPKINENDEMNEEYHIEAENDNNINKNLQFVIVKNGNNEGERQSYPFSFDKLYDLEYRGFTPLQQLFSFVQYADNISNYEQWYNEIMEKCNHSDQSDEDNIIDGQINDIDNNVGDMSYAVEEERIIILMNIITKV